VTRPGGFIVFSLKCDILETGGFGAKFRELTEAGRWELVEVAALLVGLLVDAHGPQPMLLPCLPFMSELEDELETCLTRASTLLVTLDVPRGLAVEASSASILLGRDVALVDDLSDQEKSQALQEIAQGARQARMVPSEDSESPCVVVPLGLLGKDVNKPILTSMITGATALTAEALAGGGEILGYHTRSVQLRGCRGCAVTFQLTSACCIL